MAAYRVPAATYRLQFNKDFIFNHARKLVPYLQELGISDLYASPIFQARSGSSHGYDVTDPTRLNPELGTEQDFEELVKELKAHGMGLLLDIVPNHMAACPENPWWADLLEKGQASPYAPFFDVDWNPAGGLVKNQIVLPILGKPYHQVLEAGELELSLDQEGLNIRYFDYRLPVGIHSYRLVLSGLREILGASISIDPTVLRRSNQLILWAEELAAPGGATSGSGTSSGASEVQPRKGSIQQLKPRLLSLVKSSPEIENYLRQILYHFKGTAGEPASFDLMHGLLSQQAYRLTYWRAGREQLNYRRFFDVSELVGVRVEDPLVFETTHAFASRLIEEGSVTGLRLDHIDGLLNPAEYLHRLQEALRPDGDGEDKGCYLVVEKILSHDEGLPADWPVAGTTGYDFLNVVNGILAMPTVSNR